MKLNFTNIGLAVLLLLGTSSVAIAADEEGKSSSSSTVIEIEEPTQGEVVLEFEELTSSEILMQEVSIIGSKFLARIAATTKVGDRSAILPEISGRGWIAGTFQLMLDPDDPWPEGYQLSDTWGTGGKHTSQR